jgi:hypothetical protein
MVYTNLLTRVWKLEEPLMAIHESCSFYRTDHLAATEIDIMVQTRRLRQLYQS